MEKVLLAEDDHDFASTMRLTINRHAPSRHVTGVFDGIRVAREMGPALEAAILDIGLVDGCGLSLARLLRKQQPDLPILVMTASLRGEHVNAAQLVGAQFAHKPMEPSNVEAFLLGALGATPQARTKRALTTLAQETDLSEVEVDVVGWAMEGTPRDSLAIKRGVKESTIKTQVRSILAKTGEPSLEAVVRRVLLAALAG